MRIPTWMDRITHRSAGNIKADRNLGLAGESRGRGGSRAKWTRTSLWIGGWLTASLVADWLFRDPRAAFSGNQADCMDDFGKYGRRVLDVRSDSVALDDYLLRYYNSARDAGMTKTGIDIGASYITRVANTNGRFLTMPVAQRMAWRACSTRGDRERPGA